MLVTKSLYKSPLVKKILNGNFDSSSNNEQLVTITESSIELSKCEYDEVIQQHIQEPIHHQDLCFIVFDCGVINNELVLITSCGLLIMKYINGKWNPQAREILNIDCENRDKLMYITINNKLNLICVYSNTNLFFIYHYSNNVLKLINEKNVICPYYINTIKIKVNKNGKETNVGVAEVITQKASEIEYNNIYINLRQYNIIPSKAFRNYPDITYAENKCRKIEKFISEKYKNDMITNIIESSFGGFHFLIFEKKIVVINFKDSEVSLVSEYVYNSKIPSFITNFMYNDFIFLIFDKKCVVFSETKEGMLVKYKFISKENKKLLYNTEPLLLNDNTVLFYNIKLNLYFTKFDFDSKNLTITFTIITKIEKDSMFSFDSALIKTSDDCNEMFCACGLKGDSRLIKYIDGYKEEKLKQIALGVNISNIIFTENNHFNLFATSTLLTSSLYLLSDNLSTRYLKDFDSKLLSICPLTENTFGLIFPKKIVIIDISDLSNNNIIDSIVYSDTKADILNVFYCQNANYSIAFLYMNSGEVQAYHFELNQTTTSMEIPLGVSISSLSAVSNFDMVRLICGTYQGNLQICDYNINTKTFCNPWNNCKTYSLVVDESTCIVPELIKVIDQYVFATSRTGEICVFTYDAINLNDPLKIFLFSKITREDIPLSIGSIWKDEKKDNIYYVDLYTFERAFCLVIDFNKNNHGNVCHKSSYVFIDENQNLLSFQKLSSNVHVYHNQDKLSFSYFPINSSLLLDNPTSSNMIVETQFSFEKDEICRKLIRFGKNGLIGLTDKNKLYTFSSKNKLNQEEVYTIDINGVDKGFKINSIKLLEIEPFDDAQRLSFIGICAEHSIDDNKKGAFYLYELNINSYSLTPKEKIPNFPKAIYDSCFIKDYLIIGMENYICVFSYVINNNTLILNKDAKQQQFLNKIISVSPIEPLARGSKIIVGDYKESFSLLLFEPKSFRFDVIGAELSSRVLQHCIPLSNTKVLMTEKTGAISLFDLEEETFEKKNGIDMKEFINKVSILDSDEEMLVMTGIMGSLYLIKVVDDKMCEEIEVNKDKINQLYDIMQKICRKTNNIYFGREIEMENSLMMACPVEKVLWIDFIWNMIKSYKDEVKDIITDEMEMLVKILMDQLALNVE